MTGNFLFDDDDGDVVLLTGVNVEYFNFILNNILWCLEKNNIKFEVIDRFLLYVAAYTQVNQLVDCKIWSWFWKGDCSDNVVFKILIQPFKF